MLFRYKRSRGVRFIEGDLQILRTKGYKTEDESMSATCRLQVNEELKGVSRSGRSIARSTA